MKVAWVVLLCFASFTAVADAGTGPFRYRHVGHIGSAGSGMGKFPGVDTAGPAGVAVDQQCGEIYIADQGAKVVHRYDQYGKPLLDIGGAGSETRGGMEDPKGIYVDNAGFTASNPLGPPPPCAKEGVLWVADYDEGRIDTFAPDGKVDEVWCARDFPGGVCDVTSPGTFDRLPNDVWVSDDRVWVAGRFADTIREYGFDGSLVRESQSTGRALSVAQWGAQLWSTYNSNALLTGALWSADPTTGKEIPLVKVFPSDGSFKGTKGVWTGIDGTLYVVDNAGMQVYSPSGLLRSTVKLGFVPEDVAARYDGTVYVTGGHIHGAEVYSPGATVTLKKVPGGRHEVRLAGKVVPGLPHSKIVLQRAEGNGWHRLATVPLNRRSAFSYSWKPPRRFVSYRVRAFWKDRRPYYADRDSAILTVASR